MTRKRWIACDECDDTRKLRGGERCPACERKVDKEGNCLQCFHVSVGHRCMECGRKKT